MHFPRRAEADFETAVVETGQSMSTRSKDQFDYIIIGSGSSGGMLGYRLSEDPGIRILMLEAGSDRMHWSIRMPAAARNNFTGGPRNWSFETEPETFMDGRKLFQPRGKVIGGSSSLNGMVFVRGHPMDYESWCSQGAAGWSYQDVLPYFKSMERYGGRPSGLRGEDGPISVQRLPGAHPIEQAFLEASEQAGYRRVEDYNGSEQEGVSAFDANIGRGSRSGTAAVLSSVRDRPNLKLLANAHVTRLKIDGRSAEGVEFLQDGERRCAYAQREVIVSAGAFQSPQLLMLSGIGPGSELKAHGIDCVADLPGVGANLQDHLEVHVKHRCPKGMSNNGLLRKDRMLMAGVRWFLFRSGPTAAPVSRVGGFLRTSEQAGYPNLQFHFWPYYLEGWSPPPDKDGYCFDVGPVRPKSRGWVKLRSANPLDSPRIALNGLSCEQDREEFRQCIRIAREIATQKAFDFCRGPEVSPGPGTMSDAQIDEYVRQNANSAYHPCGTCKIGSDELSVVDSELRVHGIDRLRVVDASVMPSITNGNINAPCLMIGERAAALLRN